MVFIFTVAILSLAALIKAGPLFNLTERQNAVVYATFYDDHACTVNGGIAVSTSNGNCLANEIGRNSIYFQKGSAGGHALLWSPDNNCGCQNHCKSYVDQIVSKDAYCLDLAGNPGAQSFRFISGDCPADNC